jgi:hypothetical protein
MRLFKQALGLFLLLVIGSLMFGTSHAAAASCANQPPYVTSTFPRTCDQPGYIFVTEYNSSARHLQTPDASLRVFYKGTSADFSGSDKFTVTVGIICRAGAADPDATMVLTGPGSKDLNVGSHCQSGSAAGHLYTTPNYYVSETADGNDLHCGDSAYGGDYCYLNLDLEVNNNDAGYGATVTAEDHSGKVTFAELTPTVDVDGSDYPNVDSYTGDGVNKNADGNAPYNALSGTAVGKNGGTAYALLPDDDSGVNYKLYFRSSCGFTSQKVYLRWYDADVSDGTNDPYSNLNFDLYDATTGSYVFNGYNTNLGNDDSYRQLGFNLKAGDLYRWEWNNVGEGNGIQVWMPFSSMNADITCPNWSLDKSSLLEGGTNSNYSTANADVYGTGTSNAVSFRHEVSVDASSPTNATSYKWEVQGCYIPKTGSGYPTCSNYSASSNGASGGASSACSNLPGPTTETDISPGNDGFPGQAYVAQCDYHFNSSANYGDKYCQEIVYDYGSGPYDNTTTLDGTEHSNPVCVKYTQPNLPTGLISCTSADHIVTTAAGDQSISDPDYSGAYKFKVDLYEDGSKVANPFTGGKTDTNGNLDGDVSSYLNGTSHVFYVYIYGIDSSGNVDGNDGQTNTVRCSPSITPSCSSVMPSADIEQGASSGLSVKIDTGQNGGSSPAAVTGRTIELTDTDTNQAVAIPTTDAIPAKDATTNEWYETYSSTGSQTFNTADGYVLSLSPSYPGVTADGACPPFSVITKPYVKVFGGDVTADSGIDDGDHTCAAGAIEANNDGASGSYAGSGTNLVTAATLTTINGFASHDETPSLPPILYSQKTLAIANTDADVTSFGGNSGFSGCIEPTATPTPGEDGTTAITDDTFDTTDLGTVEGTYAFSHTGALTIGDAGEFDIANGQQVTIYNTAGPVYIANNVKYSGAGGWASTGDIPSLKIITNGNIYIDDGVTSLAGAYVAQPTSATDGVIYTCATNGGDSQGGAGVVGYVKLDKLYTDCNQQLTIYGSFQAQTVQLLRSLGTIHDATTTDSDKASTTHTCTNGTSAYINCAAEMFEFSPENDLSGSGGGTESNYDAITSLPPAL